MCCEFYLARVGSAFVPNLRLVPCGGFDFELS